MPMRLKAPLMVLLVAAASVGFAQLGRYKTMVEASVMLIGDQVIQKDLKLTAAQEKSIRDAFSKYADVATELVRKYTKDRANKPKYNAMLHAEQRTLISKCLKVLTPAQENRLKQIGIQHHGIFSAGNPDVARELGLSDAQTKQINNYRKQYVDTMNSVSQRRAKEIRAVPQPKNVKDEKAVAAYRKKLQEVANRTREQDIKIIADKKAAMEKLAEKVLTAKQRAHFERLKGVPLKR